MRTIRFSNFQPFFAMWPKGIYDPKLELIYSCICSSNFTPEQSSIYRIQQQLGRLVVKSIASLASVLRGTQKYRCFRPAGPFEGPIHGPHFAHYGSVAHPQNWIRPAAIAEGGVLLIRHLSSFGTFRASYDAPIWPSVGIADVLRNVMAYSRRFPVWQRLNPLLPVRLAYSRFADSPILEPPLRTWNANLDCSLWLAYKGVP